MKRSFSRVAIVNRGEAALRFIHAALELNREGERLHTIALYTEPDRHALFVREADEAWDLGPAMVAGADGRRKVAYVDLGRLEEALRETRAEAAWPGWGFVAEQPAFAELCERLGVTFIGPSPAAMRALGDKIASKRLAEGLGIPVVPWAGAPATNEAEAARQAAELGFPVMVKATAGIGGRGIREAETPGTLPTALKARAGGGLEVVRPGHRVPGAAPRRRPPGGRAGGERRVGRACGRCPRARRPSSGATRSSSRSRRCPACPRRARRRCGRRRRASSGPRATWAPRPSSSSTTRPARTSGSSRPTRGSRWSTASRRSPPGSTS